MTMQDMLLDNDFVSDRLDRTLSALAVDDEDSFVYNGQAVDLSTLQTFGNKATVSSRAPTAIPADSYELYVWIGASAVFGAVLHHAVQRWMGSKSKRAVKPKSTAAPSRSVAPSVPPPVVSTLARQVSNETSHAAPTRTDETTRNAVHDDEPDLVPEDYPGIGTRSPCPPPFAVREDSTTTHLDGTLTIPAVMHTTTIDTAREAIGLMNMVKEAASDQGIDLGDNTSMMWAMTLQSQALVLNAREHNELRRLAYDSAQRAVDRQLTSQQHAEIIEVHQSEPDWLTKLKQAYDRCASWWVPSLIVSATAVAVVDLAEFWLGLRSLNMIELVCYGTGTVFDGQLRRDPVPSWSTPTSNYGMKWYASYLPFGIDALNLGDMATCSLYAVARLFAVVLAMVPLVIFRSALSRLYVPEHVVSGLFTAYLVFLLCWSECIPQDYIWQVATLLVAASVSVHVVLRFMYETMRQEFQTLGTTPSIASVNEKLAWFDDTAHRILLLPVLVGMGYFLFRCLCTETFLMA
jgi:hypothetical protein